MLKLISNKSIHQKYCKYLNISQIRQPDISNAKNLIFYYI